ncbi:MAG: iron-sulfur cluster assembly scaffold protein [Proteobacteria bacterium]|nr:iron-sulfur cluster assembly scaffold protein [Pseudomonadota bacterium]
MSRGLYDGEIKALAASQIAPQSLPGPDLQISVDNPFCGDRIDLQLNIEAGRVTALAQDIRACMLCQASANVVAKSAIGLSRDDIEAVSIELTAMLKGNDSDCWPPVDWESLALFEPVSRHKSRHGCVTLPFTALLKALPDTP